MLATFVFTSLLSWVIAVQAILIALLLLFGFRVIVVSERRVRERNRARRERDDARANLATLRRMSEIRVETVTRLRGFQ